jgi:hypothetical protein
MRGFDTIPAQISVLLAYLVIHIHFDIIDTSYTTLYVQRKTYANINSIVWGTKGSNVIT